MMANAMEKKGKGTNIILKIDKEKSIMTITTVRDGRFLKIRGQEVEYCLPDNDDFPEAIIEKEIPV